jgi:hypothetical protein
MADFKNTVLTVFRAETAEAKAAIASLKGVERDRAKALLDDLNKQNASLEDQVKTWFKVGAAVGGLVALYKGAQVAANAYLEDLRLASAAAGANIDRLTDATAGLVEQDDLLAFAGKAMHGTWKLNQEQMEEVLHGALALQKTMGVELKPTIDALTESIAKGNTKALKEFGITATDEQGVLKQLDGLWKGLGGNTAMAGDNFRRAGVSLNNAFDDLKGAAGKLVISLAPLLEIMAKLVGTFADAVSYLGTPFNEQRAGWLEAAYRKQHPLLGPGAENAPSQDGATNFDLSSLHVDENQLLRPVQELFAAGVTKAQLGWVALAKRLSAKGKPGMVIDPNAPGDILRDFGNTYDVGAAVPGALADLYRAGASVYQQDRSQRSGFRDISADAESTRAFLRDMHGLTSGMDESVKAALEAQRQFQLQGVHNALEAIFGSPEQMSAIVIGFRGIQNAAGSAFATWITGSGSASQAFKQMAASALLSGSAQLAGEAIKDGVLAAGALAMGLFGNPAGFAAAAQYGAAAAEASAGAVALGLLARALGAGSVPSASRGSGGGGSGGGAGYHLGGGGGGGGRGGEGGTQQTVILLGRDFFGLTDIEQQQLIYKAIRKGNSYSGHTDRIRGRR